MKTSKWLAFAAMMLVVAGGPISAQSAEPAASSSSAPAPREKKVLLLGIDGCRPDALLAADAPHLDALIDDGVFLDHTQTGADTVSGPGWSSMLTGVWADKHGVHDNSFKGRNYQEFPHFFARLKEARPDAFCASIVHWQPIALFIVSKADVSLLPGDDAKVADLAIKQLAEKDLDVLFLHFDDVDKAGHAKGFHPSVPEYIAAIEGVDAHVGRVLSALRSRPNYAQEDWLVIVSTDHGGKGTGHSDGAEVPEIRTMFIVVSGSAAAREAPAEPTYIVDVAATALTHLGVELKPEWKLDGRPVGLKKQADE
ncbi:MAG: alkaline phosphatase family protein [Pirellulales bacterium]